MSDSLQPHELQHARPPCPSPTPQIYPNSCPLSRSCHPTISSSIVPFSFCPQSLPASGSFPMSQLFASGGQSIGISASTSVLPVNAQDWSPLYLGWNSLLERLKTKSTLIVSMSFDTVMFRVFPTYLYMRFIYSILGNSGSWAWFISSFVLALVSLGEKMGWEFPSFLTMICHEILKIEYFHILNFKDKVFL